MRVWIKRIGVICLIPIALVLLLSILLYIPPFQNFAVRKATEYAGKVTGMQIGIEQIRLSFPLDLTVKGVEVVNPPVDTLLSLQSLTVRVRALPLLRKQVLVEAIDLRNVKVNTGTMIEGMEIKGFLGKLYLHADRIDLSEEKATFNTVDLSDTAITLLLNDSTSKEDTTSTPLNWVLKLDKISLDRVAFALQMPSDSLRLTAFVNKAGLNNGLVDLGAEQYKARNFDITNSTFAYDGNYAAPEQGLDFSHISLTNLNTSIDSILYQGKEINVHIKEFFVEERSGLKVSALAGNVRSDAGYSFKELDRSVFMNPDKVNARIVIPITDYKDVVAHHDVDFFLYANNYEEGGESLSFFDDVNSALDVFRAGNRMAKGTTTEYGLVGSYFANPFGPVQREEQTEVILVDYFNRMFKQGVKVGQLRTRLGIKGNEHKGPQEAATAILKYITGEDELKQLEEE